MRSGWRSTATTSGELPRNCSVDAIDEALGVSLETTESYQYATIQACYQSHIAGIAIGGRYDYNLATVQSSQYNGLSLDVYAQAKYKQTFASVETNFDVSVTESEMAEYRNTTTSVSAIGGEIVSMAGTSRQAAL